MNHSKAKDRETAQISPYDEERRTRADVDATILPFCERQANGQSAKTNTSRVSHRHWNADYARVVLSGTTCATGRPTHRCCYSLTDQFAECTHRVIGSVCSSGRARSRILVVVTDGYAQTGRLTQRGQLTPVRLMFSIRSHDEGTMDPLGPRHV